MTLKSFMLFLLGCKIIFIVRNNQLRLRTDKTEEVRRLGMGRLLEDLSRKMQHKAIYGSHDPLKILVHSTHDTAIAGLCSTLDVFDDRSVSVCLVMAEAHPAPDKKKMARLHGIYNV